MGICASSAIPPDYVESPGDKNAIICQNLSSKTIRVIIDWVTEVHRQRKGSGFECVPEPVISELGDHDDDDDSHGVDAADASVLENELNYEIGPTSPGLELTASNLGICSRFLASQSGSASSLAAMFPPRGLTFNTSVLNVLESRRSSNDCPP
eukprot:NODE_4615_length_785_cov_3.694293_g4272_i0.p1 GENE.NODE_4615_length_785_cov_3.694293_g4272_i0~~NODE_4615_length_785_cov_3.694293_g4272_i0.p1  ORF type:complete len:153 (+),score=16.11 NODE_4615_length_785_cov_3.694293_g4272_i0:68-526(+)